MFFCVFIMLNAASFYLKEWFNILENAHIWLAVKSQKMNVTFSLTHICLRNLNFSVSLFIVALSQTNG